MLRVEAERKKRGWTQTQLAFYAQINMPDISRIERGWLKPYNGMKKRLSDVLGIPADELTKEANA